MTGINWGAVRIERIRLAQERTEGARHAIARGDEFMAYHHAMAAVTMANRAGE